MKVLWTFLRFSQENQYLCCKQSGYISTDYSGRSIRDLAIVSQYVPKNKTIILIIFKNGWLNCFMKVIDRVMWIISNLSFFSVPIGWNTSVLVPYLYFIHLHDQKSLKNIIFHFLSLLSRNCFIKIHQQFNEYIVIV